MRVTNTLKYIHIQREIHTHTEREAHSETHTQKMPETLPERHKHAEATQSHIETHTETPQI